MISFKETRLKVKKTRRCVTIEGTKLKVNGRQVFMWAAVGMEELLAVYASHQHTSPNSYLFLSKVLTG